MSEPVKTQALVLRTIPYSDTSKIATLLTPDHGKVSVIAKGARSRSSKYGNLLQPLAELEVILHFKPGRDLQNLSQASLSGHRRLLLTDYDRMMAGFRILDWLLKIQIPHPDAGAYFSLAVRVLSVLDSAETLHPALFAKFYLRLSQLNGTEPNTFECGSCSKPFGQFDPQQPVGFSTATGQIYCEDCRRNMKTDAAVETPVIELIGHWLYPGQISPPASEPDRLQYESLEHLMEKHLRYHLDL